MKRGEMEKSDIIYYDSDNNAIQIIKAANEIITAKHDSSLLEDKMLIAALKEVKKSGNRIYAEIYAGTLKEAFGYESAGFYDKLKKTAVRLGKRSFLFEDLETKQWIYRNLITEAHYKNGVLTIDFNPTCEKILLDIQTNYTLLNTKTIFKMNSKAALKLYEHLEARCYVPKYEKSNYSINNKIFDFPYNLNELKLDLGAVDLNNDKISGLFSTMPKNEEDWDSLMERIIEIAKKETNEKIKKDIMPKWSQWRDFNKVIANAVEEINEKSPMNVEYEPIKRNIGGKVVAVNFKVTYKTLEEKKNQSEKYKDKEEKKEVSQTELLLMISEIQEYVGNDFTLLEINYFLTDSNYDVSLIKKQYNNYRQASKKKKINDKVAWMRDAIQKNYSYGDTKDADEIQEEVFNPDTSVYEDMEETVIKVNADDILKGDFFKSEE